jgi:hypothetical protein
MELPQVSLTTHDDRRLGMDQDTLSLHSFNFKEVPDSNPDDDDEIYSSDAPMDRIPLSQAPLTHDCRLGMDQDIISFNSKEVLDSSPDDDNEVDWTIHQYLHENYPLSIPTFHERNLFKSRLADVLFRKEASALFDNVEDKKEFGSALLQGRPVDLVTLKALIQVQECRMVTWNELGCTINGPLYHSEHTDSGTDHFDEVEDSCAAVDLDSEPPTPEDSCSEAELDFVPPTPPKQGQVIAKKRIRAASRE